MRVGIYVRVYNEKNIIEWMDYHYKCGFDFILFYDDYSKPSVKSIIEDYGKFNTDKYLVLEKLFDKCTPTYRCLNDPTLFKSNIFPHIQEHMDYVLYIDMDEYLYMDKYNTIQELITDYGDFDQLLINWVMYGENTLKGSNTLLNTYLHTNNIHNIHIKSLSKVTSINTTGNPHFFLLNSDNSITINNNKNLLHKGDFSQIKFRNFMSENIKNNKTKTNIYIAHYYTQDLNTFFQRKLFNLRDNEFRNMYEEQVKRFIDNYNEIENKEEYIKDIPHLLQLYRTFIRHCNSLTVKNTEVLDFYNRKCNITDTE